MVTFTTDYWAPALDSKARRRVTESEAKEILHVAKERKTRAPKRNLSLPVVSPNNLTNPLQAVFVKPINESEDISTTSLSTNSTDNTPSVDEANKSSEPLCENGITLNGNSSNGTSINGSTEPKKITFVRSIQKLLIHESKSPVASPLGSPEQEKEEFNFNVTPDGRTMLKEILNPKLELDEKQSQRSDSGSGSDSGKATDTESMLIKKYGVCDKGCIGKGATAVVRLAHKFDQSDCEKTYAEFRKRRKNESEKDYVKKLTSEFCISSTLQHVNVVRTVDLVQDENHNWCEVMEYCAGGDLYTAIKSGHMATTEIDCCFKQLIRGVENLLLDENGHLKITDFGVSDVFRTCWEEAAHMSKGLCGSEPYIAPEQFETKEYDARLVDVWACGIVYYCMIYQGIPFRMATPSDPNYTNYLETKNLGLYEPFEKLPSGCRELMYKILEPDAKKRITIERIEKDTWFQMIECCAGSCSLTKKHNHVPPDYLKEIQNNQNNSVKK
ncbi:5715_t:CDS:2 [Racocetra fulgida]|uniref:non-specific serine/threonine protein kinase n=1 Tax=Racocetra fulgida TaxID=60492 RepID=A0A9N8Z6R5_9GLOM|nr:5715_t:CDS:2 [Racocetra fulgida]